MDAFFAAIEQRDNPELRGKSVIIGGETSNRGVVSTASYEARKFGVHSAMPIFQARKLCPHGIFMRGNFDKYSEASKKLTEICKEITPYVKKTSIDEAYLDISGAMPLYKSCKEIALTLKRKISTQLQLTCSIGIAPNRMLAKIASEMQKPDGLKIIDEKNIYSILKNLPVEKIPGIGKKTTKILQQLGVYTAEDLSNAPRKILFKHFGKFGENISFLNMGTEVAERTAFLEKNHKKTKSIGNEITLKENSKDEEYLKKMLLKLTNKVCYRVRKISASAKTVTLKVKYDNFSEKSFNQTVTEAICYEVEVYKIILELLEKLDLHLHKIRLIGIRLSNLEFKDETVQMNIFTQDKERIGKIITAIDELREKYGREIINIGNGNDHSNSKAKGKSPHFGVQHP